MASKRKKGDKWEFVVKRAGLLDKPLYFTFDREQEGDAFCSRVEKLLDRGIVPSEYVPSPKQMRLQDVFDLYQKDVLVSRKDAEVLRKVGKDKGSASCTLIDVKWVDAWVAEMKREQCLAPATIRAKIGATARALDWAVRKGYVLLPDHPFRTLPEGYSQYTEWDGKLSGEVREDVERNRRLEAGEEDRIRAVLQSGVLPRKQRPRVIEDIRLITALFDLALETAMRLREIYTIEVSQVNLKGRTVFLSKTKNGDSRQVPLSTVAVKVLESVLPEDGPVFPFLARHNGDLKATSNYLSSLFSKIFESAGCPDFVYHDLRHEAVSRLFEKTTLPTEAIMRISGHRSHRMLMRYLSLRPSTLAESLW